MAVWKSGEKPVAVIGNNGLVGRALVKKLLERGYIVRSAIGSSPGTHLATLLIAELLGKVYRFRSLDRLSIRAVSWYWQSSLHVADEAAEMMALPGAEERLKLMVRDLLDYANILTVIEGCSSVFLTIPSCDGLNGQLDYPVSVHTQLSRDSLRLI